MKQAADEFTSDLFENRGLSFEMHGPKTLAERLEWMARNLPGFKEELSVIAEIEKRAQATANTACTHILSPVHRSPGQAE